MRHHRAFGKPLPELNVAIVGGRRGLFAILQPVLSGLGLSGVRGFDNASRALAGLAEAPSDVVLVGDVLEPIDGYLFCELLRRRSIGPASEAAVIIMAGSAIRQRELERALFAGAHQVLTLPVSAAQLTRRLTALCADARSFREADGWLEVEGTRETVSRVRLSELLNAGDVLMLTDTAGGDAAASAGEP